MTRIAAGLLSALALLAPDAGAQAQPAAPGYHVVKKIGPGGEGGWDYLTIDAKARRLYITRFNRVMVLDLDKGTPIGEIAPTPGVHGVALVPPRDRGFISNGGDSTVTVFDLPTLREVARIKVGKRPDAIVYDPASDRVFTFNAGGGDATAIDAAGEKVVGTVALGGKPEFAVADGQGHVYVNLEDKSEVLELDARKLAVTQRWPLAPGKEPTGLAMDRGRRRLFSSCHNGKMVILDADSGRVLATPPIGKGTDACIFDPDTGLAFSSNGDGTLTVVRDDGKGGYEVAETVTTQAGARTMALDPKTHNLYLVTAKPKPGQRRSYEPGSFVLLVVGRHDPAKER
jgi:DNA-binding beta-propeller fold protein YncE